MNINNNNNNGRHRRSDKYSAETLMKIYAIIPASAKKRRQQTGWWKGSDDVDGLEGKCSFIDSFVSWPFFITFNFYSWRSNEWLIVKSVRDRVDLVFDLASPTSKDIKSKIMRDWSLSDAVNYTFPLPLSFKPSVMANTFTPAIKFNGKCSFYERLNWLNSLVNINSAFFVRLPCFKINHGVLKSGRAHSARFLLSCREGISLGALKWGITCPTMLKSGEDGGVWSTASCWRKAFSFHPLRYFPVLDACCCTET